MIVRKIIGLPVYLLVSFLISVLTFLTGIAAGFCRLLSGFFVFAAIISIIEGAHSLTLQAFIFAFLFSEYGMHTVVIWLLTLLHCGKEMLYDFVMN